MPAPLVTQPFQTSQLTCINLIIGKWRIVLFGLDEREALNI
jgi:hypothetical protein